MGRIMDKSSLLDKLLVDQDEKEVLLETVIDKQQQGEQEQQQQRRPKQKNSKQITLERGDITHYHFVRNDTIEEEGDELGPLIVGLLKIFNVEQKQTETTDKSQSISVIPRKDTFSKWDESYQDLKKELCKEQIPPLYDRFYEELVLYSKVLVSQCNIDVKLKTIQGHSIGFAGGMKYVTNDLFLKQPKDRQLDDGFWLYGFTQEDNNTAAKASKQFMSVVSHFVEIDKAKDFKFPLCALIDYCGFRFEALSRLPVRNTLVYGSTDGGVTVKTDDIVNEKLEPIAKAFHLAEHRIAHSDCIMRTCGDIEIHKMLFNYRVHYFVIDPLRLFPPTHPLQQGACYYQKFRPEFLKSYNKELSSDACTEFQGDSKSIEMKNILDASKYLFMKVTSFMDDFLSRKSNGFRELVLYVFRQPHIYTGVYGKEEFVRHFQSMGINMRFLGNMVIISKRGNRALTFYLISLLISRIIKNMWRRVILSETSKEDLKGITDQYLNFIQSNFKNELLWNNLLDYAQNMFVYTLDFEPQSEARKNEWSELSKMLVNFREENKDVAREWIISNFCETCGIKLGGNCVLKFKPVVSFLPKMVYYKAIHMIENLSDNKIEVDKDMKKVVRMLQRIVCFKFEMPLVLEYLARATALIREDDRLCFFSAEFLDVQLELKVDVKTNQIIKKLRELVENM